VTDLRLVTIDGESTIPVDLSDIATSARAFADQVDAGKLNIDRLLIIGILDGAVTYTAWGTTPTVLEATGLLELASRKIERDAANR
jgi:hypothetical protein